MKTMNSEIKRLRIRHLAIFLVLLLIEVIIALFIRDRFIRPYVGDMLVVVLVYFAVRVIIPNGVRGLPFWVFLFAAGIEMLQYFRVVEILGLQHNQLMKTIIGTTFDWNDIICYACGGVAAALYEYAVRIIARRRASHK
ncbi:MAG: DUF2809 domain-containing protein [Lachnospiraceae bacterium]